MLWMPAAAAFFKQAAPDSESRLTIIRTWTPSLIMLSQIVPNFATSPPAFWMSDSIPASLNAFSRLGRSLASQRGEVVASGRMTPTLPLLPPSVLPELLLELLSLPHAATASSSTTPTPATAAWCARLLLSI